MKSTNPPRPIAQPTIALGGKQKLASREQISLRNLPDCLLAAYDGVSHRAFERFVARGSVGGNETADWRAAESELFEAVAVDLQDTKNPCMRWQRLAWPVARRSRWRSKKSGC
jgi:hypothetical protein